MRAFRLAISCAALASTALADFKEPPPTTADPNTIQDCTLWHISAPGDTCAGVSSANRITEEQLSIYNPSLAGACEFIEGNSYCVEQNWGIPPEFPEVPTPTTSTAAPTSTGNGIETPTPTQEKMTKDCNKFHLVVDGDGCTSIQFTYGVSFADLFSWNPAIGDNCQSMWRDAYICVGVIGGGSTSTSQLPATTTAPGNGISTPTPTQPGMVANCNDFYHVLGGQSCDTVILAKGKSISLADLVAWNPSINSDCSGLWANVYVCVNIIGRTITTTTSTTSSTTSPSSPPTNLPSPIQTPVASNCNKYHKVASTSTTCEAIANYWGLKLADFKSWNPSLDNGCSNLKVNHHVCVGVLPSPIQEPVAKNCNKYHQVASSSTTCQAIADYNEIKLEEFHNWNPSIKSACSNLIVNQYVCVGVLPSPIQDPVAANCNKYHFVKSSATTCQAIADYNRITIADFFKWNPEIAKPGCNNLLLNHWVCVRVPGATPIPIPTLTTSTIKPTPTPTDPGNGVTTPLPVQPNMTKNCKSFHLAGETTTCQGIADYRKIKLSDFYKWNPDVGSTCTLLFKGYNYCWALL